MFLTLYTVKSDGREQSKDVCVIIRGFDILMFGFEFWISFVCLDFCI